MSNRSNFFSGILRCRSGDSPIKATIVEEAASVQRWLTGRAMVD